MEWPQAIHPLPPGALMLPEGAINCQYGAEGTHSLHPIMASGGLGIDCGVPAEPKPHGLGGTASQPISSQDSGSSQSQPSKVWLLNK